MPGIKISDHRMKLQTLHAVLTPSGRHRRAIPVFIVGGLGRLGRSCQADVHSSKTSTTVKRMDASIEQGSRAVLDVIANQSTSSA